MPQLMAFKVAGQTFAVGVSAVNVSSTFVSSFPNVQVNYAAFLNTGSVACAVSLAPTGEAPDAVFPAGAQPGSPIFLPPTMNRAQVYSVPMGNANSFSAKALCNSSVPPSIFITPLESL